MIRTSIVTEAQAFSKHEVPDQFPEHPRRLEALEELLLPKVPALELVRISPAPASEEIICRTHDRNYFNMLRSACARGPGRFLDSSDLPYSPGTLRAASLSVGSVIESIDSIMEGQTSNGFCALRPPGHHAFPDHPEGFCYFNNVAIGARYLLEKYDLQRVAIFDWDLHHGNGTQQIFYDDPRVLFVSCHGHPEILYPYRSGFAEEMGENRGEGFNLNVPLPRLSGDREIRAAFAEKIRPAFNSFSPEFVLISAGFDAHFQDPFGFLQWTTRTYDWLTQEILEIAARHCNGKVLSVLEGGYRMAVLNEVVPRHVALLAGKCP